MDGLYAVGEWVCRNGLRAKVLAKPEERKFWTGLIYVNDLAIPSLWDMNLRSTNNELDLLERVREGKLEPNF